MSKKIREKCLKLYYALIMTYFLLPSLALADADPMTAAGTHISDIVFGTLGSSLCAILVGATFIMAKVGKVSWDRFMFVGFCVAGFLGAPSIVMMIKGWV